MPQIRCPHVTQQQDLKTLQAQNHTRVHRWILAPMLLSVCTACLQDAVVWIHKVFLKTDHIEAVEQRRNLLSSVQMCHHR